MFFDGVGGRMHYRTWRPDNDIRAVLVFLPGLGQASADYHRFGRAMNRDGLEVWALDHIGHGLSEGQSDPLASLADLTANANLLIGMAAAEHPGIPLVLGGHSLGAGIAVTAMHTREPDTDGVRAVVLTGTPARGPALRGRAPAVPTMLLHGSDDRIAPIDPVREWVSRQSGVALRVFDGAGHDLLHEPVRREVAQAVAQFVLAAGTAAPR